MKDLISRLMLQFRDSLFLFDEYASNYGLTDAEINLFLEKGWTGNFNVLAPFFKCLETKHGMLQFSKDHIVQYEFEGHALMFTLVNDGICIDSNPFCWYTNSLLLKELRHDDWLAVHEFMELYIKEWFHGKADIGKVESAVWLKFCDFNFRFFVDYNTLSVTMPDDNAVFGSQSYTFQSMIDFVLCIECACLYIDKIMELG